MIQQSRRIQPVRQQHLIRECVDSIHSTKHNIWFNERPTTMWWCFSTWVESGGGWSTFVLLTIWLCLHILRHASTRHGQTESPWLHTLTFYLPQKPPGNNILEAIKMDIGHTLEEEFALNYRDQQIESSSLFNFEGTSFCLLVIIPF